MQMFSKKRFSNYTNVFFILLGLALLIFIPTARSIAAPTAQQELHELWQEAGKIGIYQYRTDVIQTIHPTTQLANVGRSSTTQRLTVAGAMDIPNDNMKMMISRDGGTNAVDLKVEDGVTYGRITPLHTIVHMHLNSINESHSKARKLPLCRCRSGFVRLLAWLIDPLS